MASEGAYRRGWTHGTERGHESRTVCGFCGCSVPRWKTFAVYRRFGINDPVIKQQMDPRRMSLLERKIVACPSCARFRGIVKMGKSRKSRPGSGQTFRA